MKIVKLKLPSLVVASAFAVLLVACDSQPSDSFWVTGRSYLDFTVPPCKDVEGSDIDSCSRVTDFSSTNFVPGSVEREDAPPSLEEIMTSSHFPEGATHIVVRATFWPGTTRCAPSKLIPFSFSTDTDIEAIGSDFRFMLCHTGIRVSEYIVGEGAMSLTVMTGADSYSESAYSSGNREDFEKSVNYISSNIASSLEGSERILFLGPSFTQSLEGWFLYGFWDVQQNEKFEILAVAPYKEFFPEHSASLELPLDKFTQDVKAAHVARVTETEGRIGLDSDLPMLITDTNDLNDYFVNVGAYEDPDATPAPPPPVPGEGSTFTPGARVDDGDTNGTPPAGPGE